MMFARTNSVKLTSFQPAPTESGIHNQEFLSEHKERKSLALVELKTNVDKKCIIHAADKDHLEVLSKFQRFESPDWREMRYDSDLKNYLASSELTDFEVNQEFCYFDKVKYTLAVTERIVLSNTILDETDLLKVNFQSIVEQSLILLIQSLGSS